MHAPKRTRLISALVLAALVQLTACSDATTPAQYVVKATEHLEKGELQAASIQLANALQQDPGHVQARWMLARVALDLGDGARAERDVRRAMELGVAQGEARPVLVRAILLQGDLDRAITEATSVPAGLNDVERAALLALQSQALVLKGELDEARSVAEQALALDARRTEAQVAMGVIELLRGHYDEARVLLLQALESDGTSPDAWSALGELELAQRNFVEAESAFGKAIKHRHYTTLDRARRAIARTHTDKHEEAAADVRVLVREGWKDHPYVNYVAGLIHFNQKKYAEAANAFEASYAVAPASVPTRMYLATTRYLLGHHEQARLHAQWVHSNAPRSRAAGQLLAATNMSLADYAAARSALQATLRTSPEDPTTLQLLTTLALLDGDAHQGLDYAKRLAAHDPASERAREMVMLASLMAGQPLDVGLDPRAVADGAVQAPEGPEEFTRELLLALEAFRENRMPEAYERATRLHQRYPDRIDPINLIAAVYLAAGQWDLAKAELEKVLDRKPDDVSAIRNLAQVELHIGDVERGRTLLRKLVDQLPGDERLAVLLADTETRLGDRAAAISVLERAISQNVGALLARSRLAAAQLAAGQAARVLDLTAGLSNAQLQAEPTLIELRGRAHLQLGDVGAARSTFEQWVRIAPASAPARFYLSNALVLGGDGERARAELERAVQLDPQYLLARVGEVKMRVQAGELEHARSALVRLREDFGERFEVLGIEGWFALGTADLATAEQRLGAAHALHPDSELTILLARALWGQRKHEQAFEVLREWLRDHPEDVAVLMQLAGAYLGSERHAEAIELYAKVTELHPTHVPALNNVAWLSRETDPIRAMEYAQRAYRIAPEDPFVMDTLGMLLRDRGEFARAYRLIKDAAERSPDTPQFQLHLGALLIEQGRNDEARQVLEALRSQWPDSAEAREARAMLDSI